MPAAPAPGSPLVPDADPIGRLRAVLASVSPPEPAGGAPGADPPGTPDGRGPHPAGLWSRLLRARWSLPTSAGVAVLVLAAAVGATLVLRAVSTAPAPPVTARVSADTTPVGAAPAAAPSSAAGSPGAAAGIASAGPAAAVSGPPVVVDVVGAVASAGLVRLPAGSRVDDALRAAGGSLRGADLAAVNLARPLVDGEQVVVPTPGQVPAPAGVGPSGAAAGAPAAAGASSPVAAASAPVSLSTATVAQLDALPGIGPVLAQRIVDHRAQHRFASVDDLADVPGIGVKLLAKLRPMVRV